MATITIRDDDAGWKALLRELKALNGRAVVVGIPADEDQELLQFAALEEFGSQGWTITSDQAAYIARHLMHIDPTTEPSLYSAKVASLTGTTVRIPERSFLRTGFDANQGRIHAALEAGLGKVVDLKAPSDSELHALGSLVADLIKDYAAKTLRSGNASLADDIVHAADPLVTTDQLIASIKAVFEHE